MITTFAASDIHISMAAETLFTFMGFPVTNALIAGLAAAVIVIISLSYVALMVKSGRYNRFVGLVQWAFEGMVSQIHNVIPDKALAKKITPLALTIFFFVLIGYWLSVLPGLDTIKYNDVPVLRSVTADLNFTLGLAIITMVSVQLYAIKRHGGIGNLKRYFKNPAKDFVGSFEGQLEFMGEFSRGIALSLRLFGNAFAGEILLVLIAVLTSYFASVALPIFMAFELFIGFIQAYVFFILTLIFTSLAVESHDAHSPEHSSVDFADKAKQLE